MFTLCFFLLERNEHYWILWILDSPFQVKNPLVPAEETNVGLGSVEGPQEAEGFFPKAENCPDGQNSLSTDRRQSPPCVLVLGPRKCGCGAWREERNAIEKYHSITLSQGGPPPARG